MNNEETKPLKLALMRRNPWKLALAEALAEVEGEAHKARTVQ